MARFFFDVHDGVSIQDHVGVDLPDSYVARLEAMLRCQRLAASDAKQLALGPHWQMLVLDDDRHIKFRFDVKAPAAKSTEQDVTVRLIQEHR